MSSSLALTTLKATATTAIRPITQLLRPPLSSLTTPPAARSFFSHGSWDEDPIYAEYAVYTLNSLLVDGPRKTVIIKTAKDNKELKTVRVVLPGVGEDGYKVWLNQEHNAVCIEAEGEIEVPGESGRKYPGSVVFNPKEVKVEKIIQTHIKNGILKITLAKNLA